MTEPSGGIAEVQIEAQGIEGAMLLGLCALLAASTSVTLAAGTGLAFLIALGLTGLLLAIVRQLTGPDLHEATTALIFVGSLAAVELVTAISLPSLYGRMGGDLSLLVGACLLLPRTRMFAFERSAGEGLKGALLTGIAFLLLAVALGVIRESAGGGTILADLELLAEPFTGPAEPFAGLRLLAPDHGVQVALLVPGSLLMLGLLLAVHKAVVTRGQAA